VNSHHINLTEIELPPDCATIVVHLPGGIVLQVPVIAGAVATATALTVPQLRDFARRYIDDLSLRKNYKTGISLNDHAKRIEQFAAWVEQRSGTVTAQHWADYYADKKSGCKPLTARNYYRSLEPFAKWLVTKNAILVNPLANITPPSPPKTSVRSKAIAADTVQLMLDNAKNARERALVMFFRDTACRLAEAQAATWENVNWNNGEVYTVGKFGNPRTLYITGQTATALAEYQQSLMGSDNGPMWRAEKRNTALTNSGIYQVFHRLARRIEKKVKHNPHSFRHAFGRDAIAAGISLILLKDILGHEDIQSTMIYSEVDTKTIKQAHNQYSPLNRFDAS